MTLMFNPHDFYGYPDEIDAIAFRLGALARKISDASDEIDAQVRQMAFEGPKAQAIRERSEERRRMARELAGRVQELSFQMLHSATFSRQKIHELELAEERMRQGLYPEP